MRSLEPVKPAEGKLNEVFSVLSAQVEDRDGALWVSGLAVQEVDGPPDPPDPPWEGAVISWSSWPMTRQREEVTRIGPTALATLRAYIPNGGADLRIGKIYTAIYAHDGNPWADNVIFGLVQVRRTTKGLQVRLRDGTGEPPATATPWQSFELDGEEPYNATFILDLANRRAALSVNKSEWIRGRSEWPADAASVVTFQVGHDDTSGGKDKDAPWPDGTTGASFSVWTDAIDELRDAYFPWEGEDELNDMLARGREADGAKRKRDTIVSGDPGASIHPWVGEFRLAYLTGPWTVHPGAPGRLTPDQKAQIAGQLVAAAPAWKRMEYALDILRLQGDRPRYTFADVEEMFPSSTNVPAVIFGEAWDMPGDEVMGAKLGKLWPSLQGAFLVDALAVADGSFSAEDFSDVAEALMRRALRLDLDAERDTPLTRWWAAQKRKSSASS